MNTSKLRRWLMPPTLVALSTLLTGCFLQTISGATFQAGGSLITTVETDSILATCVNGGFGSANVECTYFFFDPNGVPVETASSANLISEFGILGVIIDPLIYQIPANAVDIQGTFDDGQGNSGDLVIQSGLKSIPADIGRHLLAEAGQQFVIAELPDFPLVDGSRFRFTLTFRQPDTAAGPASVKALMSAKYESDFNGNEQVFYPPLLPCETEMANVPTMTIPQALTAGTLEPIEVPMNVAGCSSEEYRFIGFGVFPCDFDSDDDVDRDDLAIQASVRNAPALPGDRMDANRSGRVDINDVRACARQCTRARCATS